MGKLERLPQHCCSSALQVRIVHKKHDDGPSSQERAVLVSDQVQKHVFPWRWLLIPDTDTDNKNVV